MTFLTNGACASRERIPVRMLLITSQIVNAFDVNVIYAKPYSRKTYANHVAASVNMHPKLRRRSVNLRVSAPNSNSEEVGVFYVTKT